MCKFTLLPFDSKVGENSETQIFSHFCYKCGVLMIDTTNGGDVGTAVTDHYNECRLFDRKWKCSIQ